MNSKTFITALLAIAFASELAGSASASTYEMDFQGTVSSGIDVSNLFGGGNLSGDSYTARFIYDPTMGSVVTSTTVAGGTSLPGSSPTPFLSASITINGDTYVLAGGSSDYYGYVSVKRGWVAAQFCQGASACGSMLSQSIYESANSSLTNVGSYVALNSALSIGGLSVLADNLLLDPTKASISAISATPLPASGTLMVSALAIGFGIAFFRIRIRHRTSDAAPA
jgi:hypothetical protein